MDPIQQAYIRGFTKKCKEANVNPDILAKFADLMAGPSSPADVQAFARQTPRNAPNIANIKARQAQAQAAANARRAEQRAVAGGQPGAILSANRQAADVELGQ